MRNLCGKLAGPACVMPALFAGRGILFSIFIKVPTLIVPPIQQRTHVPL